MTSRIDVQPACGRHGTDCFYLSHRLVRVCEIDEIEEIELSHMGKNNGNPDSFHVSNGKSVS